MTTWKLKKREMVPGDLANRTEEKFTYSNEAGESVAVRWNTKVPFGVVIQSTKTIPPETAHKVATKWVDAQFVAVNENNEAALDELTT